LSHRARTAHLRLGRLWAWFVGVVGLVGSFWGAGGAVIRHRAASVAAVRQASASALIKRLFCMESFAWMSTVSTGKNLGKARVVPMTTVCSIRFLASPSARLAGLARHEAPCKKGRCIRIGPVQKHATPFRALALARLLPLLVAESVAAAAPTASAPWTRMPPNHHRGQAATSAPFPWRRHGNKAQRYRAVSSARTQTRLRAFVTPVPDFMPGAALTDIGDHDQAVEHGHAA
jgi:hypothetical protein